MDSSFTVEFKIQTNKEKKKKKKKKNQKGKTAKKKKKKKKNATQKKTDKELLRKAWTAVLQLNFIFKHLRKRKIQIRKASKYFILSQHSINQQKIKNKPHKTKLNLTLKSTDQYCLKILMIQV